MRPDFDIQGHRGARGLLPENTLPAFRKALELGVTTLEMDVVISADHQVVVSHDPWLSAAICSKSDGTPVSAEEERGLAIYSMSYEEVVRFDCGMRPPPGFPEQQPTPAVKPLLREVIKMADGLCRDLGRPKVRYNIETKSRPRWDGVLHPEPRTFTELLYSVLREQGIVDRSLVQSFDPRTLREARRIDPDWRTSLLLGRIRGRFPRLGLRRLGFVPHVYSPHFQVLTAKKVGWLHRMGMYVIPWTVNDDGNIARIMLLGVDGLITDYPDRARRILERLLASEEW